MVCHIKANERGRARGFFSSVDPPFMIYENLQLSIILFRKSRMTRYVIKYGSRSIMESQRIETITMKYKTNEYFTYVLAYF